MIPDHAVHKFEFHNLGGIGMTNISASMQSKLYVKPTCIDELNSCYASMGWEGSYTQMQSGPFEASFSERTDQRVVSTTDSLSVPVHTKLSTLPDCYMLCMLISNSPGTVNGYNVDPNSLILIHPDKEFFMSTTGPSTTLVTFIPKSEVENQLGDACESIFKTNQTAHIFHEQRIAATNQFKCWFRNWRRNLEVPGQFENDLLSQQAENIRFFALHQIAERLENNPKARERIDHDYANRRIADLIDYFYHHSQSMITIPEMAELSGMSRRNLFYKFTQFTGYSPQRFYKYVRLAAFRRALQQDEGNITELGIAYGFNNLGELAALYKDVFGELPKQTKNGDVSIATKSRIPIF